MQTTDTKQFNRDNFSEYVAASDRVYAASDWTIGSRIFASAQTSRTFATGLKPSETIAVSRASTKAEESGAHVNYKEIWLGTFDTPELAHVAYRNACVSHHGEFARV